MSNVLRFRKKRNVTIRGAARAALTEAMASVNKPAAAVIVTIGADGTYALRSVMDSEMNGFDTYSRAGAIVEKERLDLID